MVRGRVFYLIILALIAGTLACSISGARQQAQTIEQTAQALRTEVGGFITAGGSLLSTSQALETQHPGILGTARAFVTQAAPALSTIQAVATYNPGLVQTAQAAINQEIPTGDPPSDIPILNRDQAGNYFGSSQYIFYTSPTDYPQVLDFYKTEMPNNGWLYLQSDSHEYSNAAQLNYYKDTRTATINLSLNPLNDTTVVVISTIIH
ncbi:MAG: hypothetical protein A2032_07500 [Chloroflexi bacterium RBG_19FT_COMBO_49_13]|nr:MAG: hypothetical protein A2032_07500 [Chloroflexi bacterium RBG_19FT_COMBO_49_13]